MSTIWDLVKAKMPDLEDAYDLGETEVYIGDHSLLPLGVEVPHGDWIVILNDTLCVMEIEKAITLIRDFGHVEMDEYDDHVLIGCGEFVNYDQILGEIYGTNVAERLAEACELVPADVSSPMGRVKYGDLVSPALGHHKTVVWIAHGRKHWVATVYEHMATLAIFPDMESLVEFVRTTPIANADYVPDIFGEPTILVDSKYGIYPEEYRNFGKLWFAAGGEPYVDRAPICPLDDKHYIVLRETGEIAMSFERDLRPIAVMENGEWKNIKSFESDIVDWLKARVDPMPTSYAYSADAAGMPCIQVGPYDVYAPDGVWSRIMGALKR